MQTLTKQEVRRAMSKLLRNLSPENRSAQSIEVTNRIQSLKVYKEATSVALFLSMKTEVDTQLLIEDCFKSRKTVLVPKIISDSEFELVSLQSQTEIDALPIDKWGIPIPPFDESNRLLFHPDKTPDLIIVPGVAFDSQCQRLGHGKGYYGNSKCIVMMGRSLL